MTTYELITAFLSIAVPITSAIAWLAVSLNKKFDKIDQRFDRLESKVDSIQIDLKKLNIRVAHIEGAYFGKELPKHVVIGED